MGAAASVVGVVLLGATGVAASAALRVRGRAPFAASALVLASASVIAVFIVLSLADALTREAILGGQALLAVVSVAAWKRAGRPPPPYTRSAVAEAVSAARAHPALELVLLVAAVAIALQAVQAVATTPNNWDSMTYHLSRAAYWLQNESATQFSGGSTRQNESPPNAEMLQAWTMSVSGTDWFAQLVQWAALVGLGLLVFSGARLIRFDAAPAAFAAALFVLLPQPVMQASSTQNDLVVTFFVAATAFFGVRGLRDRDLPDLAVAAVAAGLAVGTKGTALVAAPSLALIVGAALWHYRPPRRLALLGGSFLLAGVVAFGSFNYALNLKNTGSLFGGVDDQTERRDPVVPNAVRTGWTLVDLPGVTVGWLDVGAGRVARAVYPGAENQTFGYSVDSRVHEDLVAFGPVGLFLFVPLVIALALRRRVAPAERVLALACLLYAAVFVVLLNWNPWLGRVLVPAALLGAPLLAHLYRREWLTTVAIGLALAGALPALLVNELRPLLVQRSDKWAWSSTRYELFAKARTEMGTVLTRLDQEVGRDEPLAFVGGEDSWDYPLFGSRRQRRVVRVPADRVSLEWLRERELAGAVFFNLEPPPGLPKRELDPGYYFVPAGS